MRNNFWRRDRRWSVLLLALVVLLAGCGGGGGGGGDGSRLTLSGVVTVPENTSRQATSGYALANATVKGYIWPNLTEAIAQTTTDANGRYTLNLPEDAAGKDILVVATKQVGDRTVRVATIAADVPATGRDNVHLDAFTTFAVEEIAYVRTQEGLDNLSAGGFADVVRRLRERMGAWNGDLASVLPPQIGGGLQEGPVHAMVQQIVQEMKHALKGSVGDVAVARGMMQTLRDMMVTVVNSGEGEDVAIHAALNAAQEAVDQQLAAVQAFSRRFDVVLCVLKRLEGRAPGEYHLVGEAPYHLFLERVGDISGGKTWKVISQLTGHPSGLVITVTAPQPMEEFRFDPGVGTYTVSATKQGVDYSATLTPIINQANRTIELRASINLQDDALSRPITFNGTLVAVFAQLPAGDAPPQITNATFNGQFQSQFGSAQVTNLRMEFEPDSSQPDSVKRITLQRLQAQITARPFSLSLQGVDLPFMKLSGGGTTPSRVIVNTLQITGVDKDSGQMSLTLSEVSGTLEQYRDPVNGMGSGVLKSLQGKLNFASSRMTLSGEFSGTWNNPVPFAQVSSAGQSLSTFPEGSIRVKGNMTPAIGKPAGVDITFTSAPKATPPTVTMTALLSYGNESIQMTAELRLRERAGGVYVATGNFLMTHSPSGVKMTVTGEEDRPPTGTIQTADGTKLADVGEAQALGLPDLGEAAIVKYIDGTFETLQSLLP